MLNAIQTEDDGSLSLLVEAEIRDENGEITGRLPEAAYPIGAVPAGSLTEREIAWVKKLHPDAEIIFTAANTTAE
jgi:hypothetical protein